MFRNRRVKTGPDDSDLLPGESQHNAELGAPGTRYGIPVGIFPGFQQDQHMILQALPGGISAKIHPGPTTFARYNMSRGIHDVQLSNGWQNTNYGRIQNYLNEGYMAEVMPQIPGQSRLFGTNKADFVMRGPAPSQWANVVANVQKQPMTQGGPGQLLGPVAMGGSRG